MFVLKSKKVPDKSSNDFKRRDNGNLPVSNFDLSKQVSAFLFINAEDATIF